MSSGPELYTTCVHDVYLRYFQPYFYQSVRKCAFAWPLEQTTLENSSNEELPRK